MKTNNVLGNSLIFNSKVFGSIMLSGIALASASANASSDKDTFVNVHGGLHLNYAYEDYNESSEDKLGDFTFDVLALQMDAKHGDFGLSAEYRFSTGSHYIKYGYVYYQASDDLQIQLGVNKVPFGNPEYISNSYWFSIPYWMGFEDDHDLGLKANYDNNGWSMQVAFYKGAEYQPSENKRYGADLYTGEVNGTQYNNEELNQLNFRQTYTLEHKGGSTKLGGSFQVGQIYNAVTEDKGERYAVALHLDSSYNDWNLQLQAMQYEFDADDMNPNKIAVSILGGEYEVASKGQIYDINVSKDIKTSWGSYRIYNDFSVMTPDVDDSSYDNTLQNILGVGISAGPTYTWVDLITSKNMAYTTQYNNHIGLAEIGDQWDNRFNINVSYYF